MLKDIESICKLYKIKFDISQYQKLSEEFIKEFQDKVNWESVSIYQKLSEEFIKEFQDKVNWESVSIYQKLSEEFIKEFQDKVDWYFVSANQKLSEEFIKEFQDKVNWESVSRYQRLSVRFRRKFNLQKPKNNWLYSTVKTKLQYIKKHTNYEIIDNEYIIAYKSVRSDGYSLYNFQYFYEVGKEYEAHCDCNLETDDSFGLSAWTKEKALEYHSRGKLLKVKIFIKDIEAIVQNYGKIRCRKLKVLEEYLQF
jgi:hypothetical protein